ncbi:hypothetical protein [Bacillus cereus]|jgi:type IV secretory pathway VirB4 component|nr:hypothetical protein [Bacillus cereus]BCC56629.1 hypothetical protein BCJMU07_p328 [Bacillus cereus]
MKKQLKEELQNRKSAQDLIPIKRFDTGVFITDDYRIVQMLQVSSLNLELMSNRELNEILEKYEMFLRSIHFPIQTTIVSQPINLQHYVKENEELLERTTNPFKRELLESYIDYARDIERNQDMMQRKRYIVTYEQILGVTRESYYDALHSLEDKIKHLKVGLEEVGLHSEEVSDLEMMRYLHTLFDYNESQHNPIKDEIVLPMIIKENLV